MIDITIVIVNFNTKQLTLNCLNSIFKKRWQFNFNVVLIDNGSSDNSVQAIKKDFPQVDLIESDKNLGFAGGNNLGIRKAKGEYILLLNSDTELQAGSLDNLIRFARELNFDISSCRLIDKNGSFQPNAGELPTFLPVLIWLSNLDGVFSRFLYLPSYQESRVRYYQKERQVGWVSGSVMLIKNEAVKKIGLLDDKIFMYGEDVEYCLRAARKGFKVGWTNGATVEHLSGASSKDRYFRQWRGEFLGLFYIYRKYYGLWQAFILRLLIYIFVTLRIIAFGIVGQGQKSLIYGKILFAI